MTRFEQKLNEWSSVSQKSGVKKFLRFLNGELSNPLHWYLEGGALGYSMGSAYHDLVSYLLEEVNEEQNNDCDDEAGV